jgi:predicted pyridoxine 5'-phosphate oxidase superfamily flavin-nucleotide-binding protein
VSEIGLEALERCFGGAIPAVLATASADGVPNVTYISRAHRVDDQRIALSNQFMTKTSRNLAANPVASLLLVDPSTHDEYRVTLRFERTVRRGSVFERLRADVEALASLQGMQDVFRLRAADIHRVLEIEHFEPHPDGWVPDAVPTLRPLGPDVAALGRLAASIGRAGDLDVLVDVALGALERELGYRHTLLLLADDESRSLFTIATHGLDAQGVGAEVRFGDGLIGLAAERCEPIRVAALGQAAKYAGAVRRGFEDDGATMREVPLPSLADSQSRIAVPCVAAGSIVGVLVADSPVMAAFGPGDEAILGVAATLLANAVVAVRSNDGDPNDADPNDADPNDVESRSAAVAPAVAAASPHAAATTLAVRYYVSDGSVFVDGDYLVKGVPGRILWSLLRQYTDEGRTEFTNRELRRDPALELPGFKDNFESRLILLRRRLDERRVPLAIERTGRGRFRLQVSTAVRLESAER